MGPGQVSGGELWDDEEYNLAKESDEDGQLAAEVERRIDGELGAPALSTPALGPGVTGSARRSSWRRFFS